MNRLPNLLVALAALALLCVTVTYWGIKLMTPAPVQTGATNVQAPESVASAARLFGDAPARNTRVRLSGILSLGDGRGAAAIVSVDGAPSHAIGVGQHISSDITLSDVRAHSIVVNQNGTRSEIDMDTVATGPGAAPTIYMR